ncbi:integral membrane protein, partial [Glonium stellatum]
MSVDHIRGSISDTARSEKLACIVFCLIDPIFVATRFWSRWTVRQIGADDWISLVAFVRLGTSLTTCGVLINLAHQYGWGHHTSDLPAKDLEITLILHWTFQITYKLSVALNKASIILLFLRIMPQKSYRIFCWALLTIISLFAISTIIAGVFQCVPVDKAWHKKKPGYCYPL